MQEKLIYPKFLISFKKGDNKEITKSTNFDIDVKKLIVLLFLIFKFPGNIILIIFISMVI